MTIAESSLKRLASGCDQLQDIDFSRREGFLPKMLGKFIGGFGGKRRFSDMHE